MGIIISGKALEVPGLTIQNYKDVPKFKLKTNDGRPRPDTWVRAIVLHTTRGIPGGKVRTPQTILAGQGPNHRRDEKVSLMWSLDNRKAGAHLICDSDSSWVCTCDLARTAAYHAGTNNKVTIGIEIYQEPTGSLYYDQLRSVVTMVDFLTRAFGIQRQVHLPYLGRPVHRPSNGHDMVGVYGHRDISSRRGLGDPGEAIYDLLVDAGYERLNYDKNEDLSAWSGRQKNLGLLPDGIAGPRTVQALAARGYHHGLWVSRPGD